MDLDFLKRLGRGTYTLVVYLSDDAAVAVGSLGHLFFERGLYSYTGSALGPSKFALYHRVRRHLGFDKRLHWHIDFLLNSDVSRVVAVCAASSERFECKVAGELMHIEGVVFINGFGSSDCNCVSHLHYFGDVDLDFVLSVVSDVYRGLMLKPYCFYV